MFDEGFTWYQTPCFSVHEIPENPVVLSHNNCLLEVVKEVASPKYHTIDDEAAQLIVDSLHEDQL